MKYRAKKSEAGKNKRTISVTDEVWETLKSFSSTASLSISELIEQWVRNNLTKTAANITKSQALSIITNQIENGHQETVIINETITKDDGEKIVVTSRVREVKKTKPPSDSLLKFIVGSEPIDKQINWLLNEEIIDGQQAEKLSVVIEEFRRATIAIVKGF
jgi:predicted CopG family antitoxin